MTKPPDRSLGAMIRRVRRNSKMPLRDLAWWCHVKPAFLSDVELGKRTPSQVMLRWIWREVSGMNSDLILWEEARVEQLAARYRAKVEAQ